MKHNSFMSRVLNLSLLFVFTCIASYLLNLSTVGYADTVLDQQYLFSGRNVYAPTAINDDGLYKLWYGGWQNQNDYPNDKIYYRTSSNNTNWSSPVTVLTPSQIGSNVVHVNDPSVTKHFNSATNAYQYTMFYTVCVSPCNQSDNQIWSSVSNDGINWSNHQLLLASSSAGPAEPSAVLDPSTDGTFWKVYYVDRLDATKVKMARVNGNRYVLNVQVVYTFAPGNVISSAEVKQINGTWSLFYNVFFANTRVDAYKSESTTNESWPSTYQALIVNTGPTYCASLTPGVLPSDNGQYDLYYGLTSRSQDGTCDVSNQYSMQRWRWTQ